MKQSFSTINQITNALEIEHTDIEDSKLSISFIRTLRIPDDNKVYNLPPGLGQFPLNHVEDYPKALEKWQSHGGIFLPMYQSEAMWLRFNSTLPYAIKIATGKINAISGEAWSPELKPVSKSVQRMGTTIAHDMLARPAKEQEEYLKQMDQYKQDWERQNNQASSTHKPDYLVVPKQPWLDGFNVGKGRIRQFVAMPLGAGYTVEEQLTGKAEHGGIQIIAYPMKKDVWAKIKPQHNINTLEMSGSFKVTASAASSPLRSFTKGSVDMGLGAGGFMKQDIYADPYEADVWDLTRPVKIFVHLLNSLEYTNITGKAPLTQPLGPEDYARQHYPWFDYYDEGKVLEGSEKLAKVDSIASMDAKKNQNSFNTMPKNIIKDGQW